MDVLISAYRARVGGYVGDGHVHPALLDAAREGLAQAKETGAVADGFIARCGDDIDLVLFQAAGRQDARTVAHGVFEQAVSAGARLRQHGNGGVELDGVELSFVPRPSEPVLCFFSNKAGPGAWGLLAYRMLADPFVTPGLMTDASLREGFSYTTRRPEGETEHFDLPGDLYMLLDAIGSGACVVEVRSRACGEVAVVASSGSDPVLIARCESPFPAVEDALEAFATVGSIGGLAPVSANADPSTRSIPRAIGLGFQVTPDRLVGPRDLLGDSAFDDIRKEAVQAARLSRNGRALRSDGLQVRSAI